MNAAKPRILVVDDEAMILRVVLRMLALLDADPVGVGDLAAARAALARERFDLVLSDVGLPDGSGLDLAAALLDSGSPPIVLMSGAIEQVERAAETLKVPALTKPIGRAELRAALERCGIALPPVAG